jgi:hypothetical protein
MSRDDPAFPSAHRVGAAMPEVMIGQPAIESPDAAYCVNALIQVNQR